MCFLCIRKALAAVFARSTPHSVGNAEGEMSNDAPISAPQEDIPKAPEHPEWEEQDLLTQQLLQEREDHVCWHEAGHFLGLVVLRGRCDGIDPREVRDEETGQRHLARVLNAILPDSASPMDEAMLCLAGDEAEKLGLGGSLGGGARDDTRLNKAIRQILQTPGESRSEEQVYEDVRRAVHDRLEREQARLVVLVETIRDARHNNVILSEEELRKVYDGD